jgi:oligopeptidase A
MQNPLLDFTALPRFSAIRAEHVAPAIDTLITEGNATIERLAAADAEPTWENFVEPLDDANERLSRAWGQVGQLNAMMNSPSIREAYNASLPRIAQFFAAQGQDQRLYAGFKSLAAASAFAGYSPARKRFVENQLRDFRLAARSCPPPQKARFMECRRSSRGLGSRFQDNVLGRHQRLRPLRRGRARASGIPADVRETAREAARKDGRDGWKLTLHMPATCR